MKKTKWLVFKQRMQLNGCKKVFKFIKVIIQSEGLRALFRSLPITIVNFSLHFLYYTIMNDITIDDKPAIFVNDGLLQRELKGLGKAGETTVQVLLLFPMCFDFRDHC